MGTAQIYTHVSIQRLKEVHHKVHPAPQKAKPNNLEPPGPDAV